MPYAEQAAKLTSDGVLRTFACAMLILAGGYLAVTAAQQVTTLIIGAGAGYWSVSYVLLTVVDLLFGIAVLMAGFLLLPGPLVLRLVGVALPLIAVAFYLLLPLFDDPLRADRLLHAFVGRPHFMVAGAVATGWLLARRCRLGWIVLAAFFVVPVTAFILVSVGSAIDGFGITLLMHLVTAAALLVALVAGRPWAERGF